MFLDGSCNVKIEGSCIKLVATLIFCNILFFYQNILVIKVLSLQLQFAYVLMFFNCSISLLFLICNSPKLDD
jgi:hypothetical protein